LLSFEKLVREKPKGTGRATSMMARRLGRLAIPEKDKRSLVQKVLDSLRETERLVVALRFYEGMAFDEIAEALVIPEGRVKESYARMVEKLARIAEQDRLEMHRRSRSGKLRKAS